MAMPQFNSQARDKDLVPWEGSETDRMEIPIEVRPLKPSEREFEVDGQRCIARKPQDGQVAVMMATSSRYSPDEEQVAGQINFFFGVLHQESRVYLARKMLDADDDWGIDEMAEVMEWLIGEWSGGHPTKRSSGSSRSQKSTGRKSTAAIPAST